MCHEATIKLDFFLNRRLKISNTIRVNRLKIKDKIKTWSYGLLLRDKVKNVRLNKAASLLEFNLALWQPGTCYWQINSSKDNLRIDWYESTVLVSLLRNEFVC